MNKRKPRVAVHRPPPGGHGAPPPLPGWSCSCPHFSPSLWVSVFLPGEVGKPLLAAEMAEAPVGWGPFLRVWTRVQEKGGEASVAQVVPH